MYVRLYPVRDGEAELVLVLPRLLEPALTHHLRCLHPDRACVSDCNSRSQSCYDIMMLCWRADAGQRPTSIS